MTIKIQKITGWSDGTKEYRENNSDFYPTPPIAVEKLLDNISFGNDVWEPCCGDGAISKILIQRGHNVESSDLNNWGYGIPNIDFLKSHPKNVDAIITNPPFNLSYQFAMKSFESVINKKGKVALLNRLQWLEGIKRRTLFEDYPLEYVLVFSKRIPRMQQYGYTGKVSTSMIAFAWFVWNFNYSGEPKLKWI